MVAIALDVVRNWIGNRIWGMQNARTNREIKMGHNLFKMWQSGEFNNEQYRSKGEVE